jgi:DNA polymerase-3 subunit beta
MKLSVPKAAFQKALARVQSLLDKRSSMPILSHVLIEASEDIRLKATNLQVYYDINLKGEIEEPGTIALPGRKLFNLVKESRSDKFTFVKNEENTLSLTDGKTHYTLYLIDPESFPSFTYPRKEIFIPVKASTFTKCLSKTIICAGEEDNYPHLAGVFLHKSPTMGKVRFGTSDNFRLALMEEDFPDLYNLLPSEELMLPTPGVNEILKFEAGEYELFVALEKESMYIEKQDELRLYLTIKSQPFIDYSKMYTFEVLSKATIKRTSLQEALKRMTIFAEEMLREVQLTFSQTGEGTLKLETAVESGQAEEVLPIVYTGDELVIYMDPRQLIQVLQVMESEFIEVSFTGDSSPCIITGAQDKGFTVAIMPYVDKEAE